MTSLIHEVVIIMIATMPREGPLQSAKMLSLTERSELAAAAPPRIMQRKKNYHHLAEEAVGGDTRESTGEEYV